MIYRMLGISAALPRVTFRRSSTLQRCKILSLTGTTGTSRQFIGGACAASDDDNCDHYPGLLRNTLPWTEDNIQFPPAGRMKMKQMEQKPISATPNDKVCNEGMMPAGVDLKQNTDALLFKVEMPGVDKKNVKVYLEDFFLVVKGVKELDPELEEDDEEDNPKTYSLKLNLWPLHTFKIAGIKAELKNGILKVTIPKVKHEERTDVLHVQVD